jgi:hypothetical protein
MAALVILFLDSTPASFVPMLWSRATAKLRSWEEKRGVSGFAENLPHPSGIFSLAQ